MQFTTVFIDSTSASESGRAISSLMTAPFGTGTLFGALVHRIKALQASEIVVVPTTPVGQEYEELIRGCGHAARMVTLDALPSAFVDCETLDYLLVFEVHRWLQTDAWVSGLRSLLEGEYRGITHAIALGDDLDRTNERIERDTECRVHRIQRLYDAKNWPDVAPEAIVCTITPARAVSGIRFSSLSDLRMRLGRGRILVRDVPLPGTLLDLRSEADFLALSEREIGRIVTSRRTVRFRRRSAGVRVGEGCVIHPAARLIPPVLIQPNSRIEEGATVIGPSLLGAGCRIEKDAIVAQSVLGSGLIVEPQETVRHTYRSKDSDSADRHSRMLPGTWDRSSSTWPVDSTSPLASDGRVDGSRRDKRGQCFVKRAIDLVVSASALTVLSPLLLAVAALIKLESRGPVFFCHRREGRRGKEFPCVKFRTMQQEAHAQQRILYRNSQVDGPQFKIDNDPRVTKVGRWLRGTNMDEIPQLFNVLVGHMSLVGPRPSPFRENQICVSWRRARLSVRPGITGLWQVCRDSDRSRGGFHEWIHYDLTYVRHFSLWLDIKIVLATLVTIGGRWRMPVRCLVPARRWDKNRQTISSQRLPLNASA